MIEEPFTVELPESLLAALAERVAQVVQASTPAEQPSSPYMTTEQAAAFLCCSRQRIHDLLGQGKLSRYKEGRRTLLLREDLEQLVRLERRRRH
ncbi:MAG: helix-turn-helix domain-containing protein [Gaiellales bacterium]